MAAPLTPEHLSDLFFTTKERLDTIQDPAQKTGAEKLLLACIVAIYTYPAKDITNYDNLKHVLQAEKFEDVNFKSLGITASFTKKDEFKKNTIKAIRNYPLGTGSAKKETIETILLQNNKNLTMKGKLKDRDSETVPLTPQYQEDEEEEEEEEEQPSPPRVRPSRSVLTTEAGLQEQISKLESDVRTRERDLAKKNLDYVDLERAFQSERERAAYERSNGQYGVVRGSKSHGSSGRFDTPDEIAHVHVVNSIYDLEPYAMKPKSVKEVAWRHSGNRVHMSALHKKSSDEFHRKHLRQVMNALPSTQVMASKVKQVRFPSGQVAFQRILTNPGFGATRLQHNEIPSNSYFNVPADMTTLTSQIPQVSVGSLLRTVYEGGSTVPASVDSYNMGVFEQY